MIKLSLNVFHSELVLINHAYHIKKVMGKSYKLYNSLNGIWFRLAWVSIYGSSWQAWHNQLPWWSSSMYPAALSIFFTNICDMSIHVGLTLFGTHVIHNKVMQNFSRKLNYKLFPIWSTIHINLLMGWANYKGWYISIMTH